MAYEIELISLRCNDAKEATDEAVLDVNGEIVWGPGRIGTGDTRSIGRRVRFLHDVTVQLWEEDPLRGRRDDTRIGSALNFSENQVRALLRGDHYRMTHDFNWTRTREIDAKYTLTYALHEATKLDKSEGEGWN